MPSYTGKIVVGNSILNLLFGITDGILNLTKKTTLSVFAITKSLLRSQYCDWHERTLYYDTLARTKRVLSTQFAVATALHSLLSIIWVFAKPTEEVESIYSASLIANNTFCDISQNYGCFSVRTAKEYFLYLMNHWLFCEVLRLFITTNDVFSRFNFGKKSIIMAYALYTIPAALYTYLTCDKFSCWDDSYLNPVSFWRTVIWAVVTFGVLVMFIAVAFIQRKKIQTNVSNTSSFKVIYFFTVMGIMVGLMETLHIVELRMDIMTIESYESIIAVLTGAMNLLWTVHSTWNHGVSSSIRTCVDRTCKKTKKTKIELTDMSTVGRSNPEEEKKPAQAVSYLESHF